MSVKQYGIYLSYAPTVDLRHEGLGRYLASFLKGAAHRQDIHFILVCPSWSCDSLRELFDSEGVPHDRFEIIAPEKKPILLRIYEWYLARKKKRSKPGFRIQLLSLLKSIKNSMQHRFEEKLVRAQTFSSLVPLLLEGLIVIVALMTLALLALLPLFLIGTAYVAIKMTKRQMVKTKRKLGTHKARVSSILSVPKESGFVLRLFHGMERAESQHMLEIINRLTAVTAWYCPTAFWPAFNQISAPRLMCVPDVVLADFPIGFAKVGGDRFLANFESVQTAIRTAESFVTYSEAVKWETLVDRYSIPARAVSVVHHAPNDLSRWVTVSGFADEEATSTHYCRNLLMQAFKKASNPHYTSGFLNGSVDFLFYASQLRPNKNVITLLRAYEFLLRKRFIQQKLIITGNPKTDKAVKNFIKDHNLENDVLCLHGLSIQQLAACYKLASLAVNPSLSEGGCPFTFTEALSVGTPVVMARIPVTEEVLTDPQLQEMTFFDPYNWFDVANRIEWALNNQETLLEVQKRTYSVLAKRTWTDVANEHIEILDRIAHQGKGINQLEGT